MKHRNSTAGLLARASVIALAAVFTAFFAGCGDKDAADDDDEDGAKKTEKKRDALDDDDEFDDGDEYDSEGEAATSRKKLSTGKKKKPEMTEDKAETSVASVKKNKKDLSGRGKTKTAVDYDDEDDGDIPARKAVSDGKKKKNVWDDDIPDRKTETAKSNAPAKKDSSADSAEKTFQDGLAAYKRKRYSEAVKNFRVAAEKGHDEAMWKLAVCYLGGNGVRESEAEGIEYLEMAADAGNAKAKFMLLMRDVEEKDLDESTFSKRVKKIAPDLLAAAEADDPEAQALCALMCMTIGDLDGAQKWAAKAEANGFDGEF